MKNIIDTTKNPLGHAPIVGLMLKFGVPSVIMIVVSSLYNMVDQIFIGHGVGYLGNAATNVIFPLNMLAFALAVMFGDGGAAFMNLNLGQGRKKEASMAAGNVMIGTFGAGVIVAAVCICFLEPICRILGATSESMPYALDYGYIIMLGFPFINYSMSVSSIIRADGNPRFAAIVMISGAIINTILDPIFIFGLQMGVKGAAYATIIGQFLSAAVCFSYIRRFKHIDFSLSDIKLNKKVMGRICALGISSFIMQAAICLVISVVNNAISLCGRHSIYGADIPLAAFGITMKVSQIMLGVCVGLSVGCAPILSFNYGAKQMDRVRKTLAYCIGASVFAMILATICYELFPNYIVALFGSGSELYEEFAMRTFRIHLCLSALIGFQTVAAMFFQAIGKPKRSMMLSVSRQIVFFIPLIWILSAFLGIDGILWAGPAGDALAFLLALPLVIYQFKKFKRMQTAPALL